MTDQVHTLPEREIEPTDIDTLFTRALRAQLVPPVPRPLPAEGMLTTV